MTESKRQVNLFVVVPPGVSASAELEANISKIDYNFADKSPAELIDMVAFVNSQQASLEKWTKAAKEVLKAHLVAPANTGEFTVSPGRSMEAMYWKKERIDVDREAIKKEMGEDWYLQHCKTTEYYELRFAPKSA